MESLVTRLKAVVSDDSLHKLGELRIKKATRDNPTQTDAYILILSEEELECTALGDALFYSDDTMTSTSGNRLSFPANLNANMWITNGGEVSIVKKYGIKRIQSTNTDAINLADLAFCSKLENLQLRAAFANDNNIIGDLSDFAGYLTSTMTLFSITNAPKITGDIECLSNTAITQFECSGCYGLTGSIESLNVESITKLGVAECNIGGSIEGFVAKLIAAGRTSGTIEVPYIKYKSKVTYEGVLLENNSNVPAASGSNKFSWDANGNITWTA